ncbi:MAG: hypothetical protein ACJ74Y_07005 [Bryobacteraceae bacterium]
MKRMNAAGLFLCIAAGCLWADATYTETTKYTGGTLIEMTQRMASNPILGRLAGGRLQSAFQDQTSTVFVKGAKMARVGQATTTIFDLDAGTVTNVNNEKRTYSVETFEEMRQRMEKMEQRTNRNGGGELEFDVKVTKTGQTRSIKEQTASETVMTLTAKSSGSQGQMVVKVDTWLVPSTSVSKELLDYQRKLAEKFAYAFGGAPSLGPAMGGMSAAMKEMRKLDGYPVLSDISVSGVSSPMAAMGGGGGDPNAPLIAMETQVDNITSGSIDDAKLAVPAGFKQEKPRR